MPYVLCRSITRMSHVVCIGHLFVGKRLLVNMLLIKMLLVDFLLLGSVPGHLFVGHSWAHYLGHLNVGICLLTVGAWRSRIAQWQTGFWLEDDLCESTFCCRLR